MCAVRNSTSSVKIQFITFKWPRSKGAIEFVELKFTGGECGRFREAWQAVRGRHHFFTVGGMNQIAKQ